MATMNSSSTNKYHSLDEEPVDTNASATKPATSVSKDPLNTDAVKGTRPTYASLFRDNRVPNDKCSLEFIPFDGNELSLSFDEIDTVENSLGWCVVGCMVGRKMNGFAVREIIKRWGKRVKFQLHESGWITFTFESNEDRQSVLMGGPYMLYGRYLFLKEMLRC